jgi:hypothetical protein
MNMIRCLRCGAALSVTDEPEGQRSRCASCGQVAAVQQSADKADSSATAIFRPSHSATHDPGAAPSAGDSPSDQADTDPGAAAIHTIAYEDYTPGESATGSPGKGPASELYDFLAPPQNPDELGRLGPYRVLKVLGAGGNEGGFRGRRCRARTTRGPQSHAPDFGGEYVSPSALPARGAGRRRH